MQCEAKLLFISRFMSHLILSEDTRQHSTARQKVTVSIPDVNGFFNLLNPSNYTMTLGSTQPLKDISTTNLLWRKSRPAHKADNLTAICEPIV
jgi:hypothetical protein